MSWINKSLVILFVFFGIALPPTTANALIIQPKKLPVLETQFYNLNLKSYSTGQSDPLLLAQMDDVIFIGYRLSKKISVGRFDLNDNFIELTNYEVRVPFKGDESGDLILDMVASDKSLFVAVGVQVPLNSNVCGGVKILEFQKAKKFSNGTVIFSSSPCIKGEIGKFTWTARVALDKTKERLYIAGGNSLIDFQFGTWPSDQIPYLKRFTKIPTTNFYGKVAEINLKSGSTNTYAKGIRNLGGIFYDHEVKSLYLSDNGPRGGDMLYRLQRGGTYAWPTTTLGRPYGSGTTNPDQVQVNKFPATFPPIFSWTPSISPSMLTRINSNSFPFWKNNLIVGSLKGQSLRRLYVHENTVIYDEPIPLGLRIRSIIQLKSGKILVGSDEGSFLLISPDESQPGGPYPPLKS